MSEEQQTDSIDRQTALELLAEALQAADESGRPPLDWFRIGLIGGILFGAVAAALITPRSGPELRSMMLDQGNRLSRQARHGMQHVQDQVFRQLDRLHGVSE